MKNIHYAGDVLLTGDEIADALVNYAEALAKRDTSSSVTIPVRFPDSSIKQVTVLIGPASQIIAVPDDTNDPEVVDEELVATFVRQTALLGNSRPLNDEQAATTG